MSGHQQIADMLSLPHGQLAFASGDTQRGNRTHDNLPVQRAVKQPCSAIGYRTGLGHGR